MIVRNRIWEELKQAKVNLICLQRYTDQIRGKSRYFNLICIIVASAGAVGGVFKDLFDGWIAPIASGIIAVAAILKSLIPNLFQSEQELSELDRLSDYYSKYLNAMEKIWYEHENKISDEKTTMTNFFAIKEEESDKLSSMNKGVRSLSEKEEVTINNKAEEYVNRVYLDKYEKNEYDKKS